MGLYGHFDVVNGTDITFFICNETAFNEWIDGHDIVKYELKEDVTSSDYEFLSHGVSPPPRRSAIRWYLVFDNTDSPSTAQTVLLELTGLVLIPLNARYMPLAIQIRSVPSDSALRATLPPSVLTQH